MLLYFVFQSKINPTRETTENKGVFGPFFLTKEKKRRVAYLRYYSSAAPVAIMDPKSLTECVGLGTRMIQ